MKTLKIFSVLALVGLCSCEEYQDDRFNFSNAYPAYVQMRDYTVDRSVTEGSGSTTVQVELPIPVGEDVTVTYKFEGSAVFNTDFKIDGATASGGTSTIKYDVNTTAVERTPNITVLLLKDGKKDGAKVLEFTLVSAKTASGKDLGVGRGPVAKKRFVKIADID